MAKLPRAIIKKYGITKKAWAVYRGSKSRGTRTMAKRRTFRARARRVGRRVVKYAKRAYAKSRSFLSGFVPLGMMETLLSAGVGATLGLVGNLLSMTGLTDFLSSFLGAYANEAALGLAAALLYKFSSGTVKTVAREYYRAAVMSAGAQFSSGLLGNNYIGRQDLIGA